MTFSPELTFMPRRHPHEITDRQRGEALVKRINVWLMRLLQKTGIFMFAKLDPHHNIHRKDQTWIVEIVPYTHFETEWLDREDESHDTFMRAMEILFNTMRDRFDLVPSVVKRKGDTDYHFAGGGCHVHLDASLYGYSTHFYQRMERFHRNLVTDYANRPYIHWLLSHWITGGSAVGVTADQLRRRHKHPITEETVFEDALFSNHAIESRFMSSGKNSYLTFEFRIVGMVENPRQLRAAVLLLKEWVNDLAYDSYDNVRPFTLTLRDWQAATKEQSARKLCKEWVEGFELQWADYERDFFDRNYLLRIQNRKFD